MGDQINLYDVDWVKMKATKAYRIKTSYGHLNLKNTNIPNNYDLQIIYEFFSRLCACYLNSKKHSDVMYRLQFKKN